jgi:CRP-like cAMP-binding protein
MPAIMLSTDTSEADSFGSPTLPRHQPRLNELAILRDFDEQDRIVLEEAGTSFVVNEGERVITQGERHDAVIIVLAGRFLVTGDEARIAEIGVGQICGEMEMLSPPHSMASVTALSDASIWRITRAQLRVFLEAHPSAGRQFMKLLTSTFAARLK